MLIVSLYIVSLYTYNRIAVDGRAKVLVGNQPATILGASVGSISAITPASTAGTSAVAVVNPDGQSSNTLIFTYQ
jgi:hypothetical protein